jgi:hypothetical protein
MKLVIAAIAFGAALAALNGCGHTALVAATTSSGHTYQYCLEVTDVIKTDTLFCAALATVESEKARLEKECPTKTFAIVPAK